MKTVCSNHFLWRVLAQISGIWWRDTMQQCRKTH